MRLVAHAPIPLHLRALLLAVLASSCSDAGTDPAEDTGDPSESPAAPATPGAPSTPGTPNLPSMSPSAPSRTDEGNPDVGGLEPSARDDAEAPGTSSESPAPAPDTPDTPASGNGADPVIPAPSGPCPEFRTGTQTILGLSTEIVAGEPVATKGPLLFTWHGTGGSGRQALFQLPQSVQRDITARGGIVIAPSDNGQTRAGQDVTFVLGVWYDGADLAYADQIVACAVQNHNIDPRQIYVTGCSAGGLMAGVMSLERSSYVAAAAPNSGGITAPTFRIEDPAHVPAVMTMHGGSTDNVIVNFGDTSRQLISTLSPLGAFLVDCNHESGHCGAPASLHEMAWEFMKAHPFGTRPSPYAGGLPADFPEICAIQ
jgi:predicted esterase